MIEYPPDTFYYAFLAWSLLWVVVLNIPPGSKEIATAYRLNFLHGLLSSLVAVASILGYIPEVMATPCTMSYFLVDFTNIILNDFIFKVPSYQSPGARKVEYFHHILCFVVGVTSEIAYKDQCTFTSNPYIELMFAEFSTPFLILWRVYNSDILGGLFVLSFVACRLLYHGLYFIPECIRRCTFTVGYGFGIPYNLMNLYFFVMIVRKLMKAKKKSPTADSDGDSSKKKSQ